VSQTQRSMAYKGITQVGNTCVLASVAGAVNNALDRQVWALRDLEAAWQGTCSLPLEQINFSNVQPIAAKPVATELRLTQYVDTHATISSADYLARIDRCIDGGGVAILSFEVWKNAPLPPVLVGWHMLSLFSRNGAMYEAWDTIGRFHTVSAQQLTSAFPYGQGHELHMHDHHDMLLVERLTP
jgi:hypothetical protein